MNRRQFTQGLGAALSTPAIPSKALASLARAPIAKASKMNPYLWGAFVARARGTLSAEILTRELNFSGVLADQVLDRLVKTNIISATNAQGIFASTSKITTPMQMGMSPSPSSLSDRLAKQADKALERLKENLVETKPEQEVETARISTQTADSETVDRDTADGDIIE